MLPVVVLIPCPLIKVRSAVLAIVTSPVALMRPTSKATLFFMFKLPIVPLAATVLMVLLA